MLYLMQSVSRFGSRPKVAVKGRPDPRFGIEQQAVAKYRKGNLSPGPQCLQSAR